MDETSSIGSVISYYCIVSSFVIFGVSMWSYELETLVKVSYILFRRQLKWDNSHIRWIQVPKPFPLSSEWGLNPKIYCKSSQLRVVDVFDRFLIVFGYL